MEVIMTTKNTTLRNHKHLTLSDRVYIETSLNNHKSFKEIACFLQKDPSTISKEVRRSMDEQPVPHYKGNDCKFFDQCFKSRLCSSGCSYTEFCRFCHLQDCRWLCTDYQPNKCPAFNTPPYVCNGCINSFDCTFDKQYYIAHKAHQRYLELLSSSRSGINMDPQKLQELNDLLSPLIRKGQPLSHVFAAHKNEIPVCRKTVYNYLDQGLFDVRNIDLPRRVRYKIRKKHRLDNPVKYDFRNKRTYKDFENYINAFPDYEVVEMDTVKGRRESGKCILTLLFRRSSFMLCFLLPSNTQKAVIDVFDMLYHTLGRRIFMKTFRIILTDNGSEFKDPWAIERDDNGKYRTKIFYCDPYASNQKGQIEKNHEFIRYIIPKGKNMDSFHQEDLTLVAQHINSIGRDSLNGQTPFDLAELLLNEKVLAFGGRKKVSPDNVLLKPALLNKKI